MKFKTRIFSAVFFIGLICVTWFAGKYYSLGGPLFKKTASPEEIQQLQEDMTNIDKYHEYLERGNFFANNNQPREAEEEYLKALAFRKDPAGASMVRAVLARFYTNMKNYPRALEQVDWILDHLLEGTPSSKKYQEMRTELLEKLENARGSNISTKTSSAEKAEGR